jgi:hypothetical protein
MNARSAAAIALLLAAAAVPAARAQEMNLSRLDGESLNHVYVLTGADHALVAGVGYARSVAFLDRTLLLGGDVTLPWGGLDVGDWRVRASALVPIAAGDRWKLSGSLAPVLRGTSDDAARWLGVGVDLGAAGGYYAPGWFVASEIGLDWEIATHVTHSDSYRRLVFADARDGWYGNPGGELRGGLQAGVSFARYDLVLRAGKLLDVAGKSPMFPLYATLALDAHW